MKITDIAIKNFRLLEDVELSLEDGATVIVGRNNSGKTSLTEFFRRLLNDNSPTFKLEDFSLGVYELFWQAYEFHQEGVAEDDIRQKIPKITTIIKIEYEEDEQLGPLAEFIVDLNDDCKTAQINVHYTLASGRISQFFAGSYDDKISFFIGIKERIPKLFELRVEALDPNDLSNCKVMELRDLRSVLQISFINAQRALDDASNKEKAVLGKVFEKLFTVASSEVANDEDKETALSLKTAAEKVQDQINEDFNEQLKNLAPAFELFGYPGLTDPKLRTETILKVEQLFSNHTTVGYMGENGVNLPESYNGLGPRNLIFILLKLFEFFKEYMNQQPNSGIHLIFIEEPEAHLHPQMQSVFIRKLEEIRKVFAQNYNNGNPWPTQFIVTTHSPHIANEATFDSMRYFLTKERQEGSHILKTDVKDLRTGLSCEEKENREFLHKYMTLTSCDLLFADRAILVEGATERLLIPEMIRKFDESINVADSKIGSNYLTLMEVGGAHAHRFFNLLDFLNLQTLVITDIDAVKGEKKEDKNGKITTKMVKCPVSEGEQSSNSCINSWFRDSSGALPSCEDLLLKTFEDKTKDRRYIAFQIPQLKDSACGRSFEAAFILANMDKFGLKGIDSIEAEKRSWDMACNIDKTDFAMKYAILETDWEIPRYILEGLQWFSKEDFKTTSHITDAVAEAVVLEDVTDV